MKNKGKNKKEFKVLDDTMKEYVNCADPLGSYTGITDDMKAMPRKNVDGKIYKRLSELPIQDADDL